VGVSVRAAENAGTGNPVPYLAAVRQFANQVLADGRDVYGRPTPLFVDGLNVDTREPVKWKWADGKEWVLCNLANQQGLLRTLDGLSQRYVETRDPQTGLEGYQFSQCATAGLFPAKVISTAGWATTSPRPCRTSRRR
jgi:hypothetical protein